MHPKIKTFLFDLDGTLIDTSAQDQELSRLVMEDILGIDSEKINVEHYFGWHTDDILRDVAPDHVDEILSVWLELQQKTAHLIQVFPRVVSVLNELALRGFSLGVVTSKTKDELSIARTAFDLLVDFDVWVTADDVQKPKPDPASVQKAVQLIDCSVGEVVMIGDTYFDLEAGKAAGAFIGAAVWGNVNRERLASYHPDFWFESPGEICLLVDEYWGISRD